MIVKNESSIILDSLNSVKDLDGFIIVDTGSTDNSVELMTHFLRELNKPFKIIETDWIDFSHARNLAINETVKMFDDCWVYWQDADEYLKSVSSKEILRSVSNTYSGFYTDVKLGELQYKRLNIFNPKLFKWEGKIHEYLKSVSLKEIKDLCVEITAITNKGFSHKNKNKHKEYGDILLKSFEESQNPRDLFYAAQSYKDHYYTTKDTLFKNKAIELYMKRASLKGFLEEVYCSLLYAGDLSNSNKLELWFAAGEVCNRLEHTYRICKYLYDLGFENGVYTLLKNISVSNTYTLFIESTIYDYKIYDLMLVLAFKFKDFSMYELALNKLKTALENKSVSIEDLDRIRENVKCQIS